MKHLIAIQNELKAPKNAYNSFGKYKYRSAEMILEAVKPILVKHKCLMRLTDELVQIGDRYYIKATVMLKTPDDEFTVTAYAREDETKKGMDGSQITGTASSYARKYALNGMFLIDDTKDADTDEYHRTTGGETETKAKPKSSKKKDELIDKIVDLAGVKGKKITEITSMAGVTELADLDEDRLENCLKWLAEQ